MADNAPLPPSGITAAADEVAYSGDTTKVQIVREVHVSGTEGSKTLTEITDTNGRFVTGPVAHDAAAAGNPVLLGAYAKAAAPSDVSADADAVRLWALRNGALATVLTAAGALVGGDATNGLDVDITRMKPDGTNVMPSMDTPSRSGYVRISDGSSIAVGIVDETGTSAVDAMAIGGGTPHDSVDSGNPIKVGAVAIAHGANPTAVAAADRTNLYANRAGVLFVIGGHPNIQTARAAFTSAQTDVNILNSLVSTGQKCVVTGFQVTLDNASTVFPSIRIGFGATTTPTTTGVIGSHAGVPAGGGFGRGDGSGIIGIGGDGEEVRITTVGTATGGGMEIVITYFLIES